MRRTKVAVLGVLMSVAVAETVQARACDPFQGTFQARFDSDIPGPPYPPGYEVHCPTSTLFPIRQCTHGELFDEAGILVASYEFGFTSQAAGEPGTARITGVSDIALFATGEVIHGRDHGYLRPAPDVDGQVGAFETTVMPHSVTRRDGSVRQLRTEVDSPGNDSDVSRIVAGPGGTGSLNLATGTASGEYVGQVCPKL